MKRIIHYIALLFVTILLCGGMTTALAADPNANSVRLTKHIALDPGDTLWSLWKSLPSPRPAWGGYWKDACTLSRIPCDDTWSKLPVGTVITVFRSDAEIAIEMESARLLQRDSERNFAIERATQAIDDAEVAHRREVNEFRTQLFDALVSLGITIVVIVVIVRSLRTRRSKEERRMEESDRVSAQTDAHEARPSPENRDAGGDTLDDKNFMRFSVPRSAFVDDVSPPLDGGEQFPVPTGQKVMTQATPSKPDEFDPDFPQPTSNIVIKGGAEQFPVPTGEKNTHRDGNPQKEVRAEQYPLPTGQKKSEDT